ncbi:MAG TPA: ATPase domain-containing protein [Ramlibacter sp.]|nr:ATPase domain-containing protein [Ramlibacter sp.]
MTDSTLPAAALQRLPSGIPGLDTILGGGFFRGGSYLLTGLAGNGKTILANQVCFQHVAAGERVVYLTMLAETHDRMLAHLRPLSFFDAAAVGATLLYFSGFSVLQAEGLKGLMELVRRAVRDHQATLLVIDGLGSVAPFAESPLAFNQFIYQLRAYLDVAGCTSLFTANTAEHLSPVAATVVDGIIELHFTHVGMRVVRELEVRKFRGSDQLLGRHHFVITDAGIIVYPRTEALLAVPSAVATEQQARLSTGVTDLDAMLGGGLLAGSTTLLLGPSGSGKSILGLTVLAAGAQTDEPGLYFGFFETPPRLIGKGDQIGLDLGTKVQDGRITFVWQPPLERSLDELADRLLTVVRQRGVRRLFIDGLNGFETAAAYPERVGVVFTALSNELRARDVTTIVSLETSDLFSSAISVPIRDISAGVENILLLRYVELDAQLRRLISIMKVRESGYDSAIREFNIGGQGITVAATFASAQAILTGHARPGAAASPPAAAAQRTRKGGR